MTQTTYKNCACVHVCVVILGICGQGRIDQGSKEVSPQKNIKSYPNKDKYAVYWMPLALPVVCFVLQ